MSPEDSDPKIDTYPGGTPEITRTTWWVGGWISPILVAAFTILWCFLAYWLIGDRPREWQYGVMPYVPGESVFSSETPPSGTPPKQVILPNITPGGNNARR